jgi:hypothetical protein
MLTICSSEVRLVLIPAFALASAHLLTFCVLIPRVFYVPPSRHQTTTKKKTTAKKTATKKAAPKKKTTAKKVSFVHLSLVADAWICLNPLLHVA